MATSSKLLDGKALSKVIEVSIKKSIDEFREAGHRPPGLGVLLVGSNPASRAYVNTKEKLAKRIGMASFEALLPENSSEEEVAQHIEDFNCNPEIDGILLQLPLPSQLDSSSLLKVIDPYKDADGLHHVNQGLLLRGEGILKPCTPLGVLRLIDLAYFGPAQSLDDVELDEIPEVSLAGKKVIVIGRSILVGKPLSFMLLDRNATVIMAHSKTAGLPELCRTADIVVAAVGVPKMVKKNWIKPGAIVIDVGINRVETGELVGDVDFEAIEPIAQAITPVPGGVGPMTVAMLIYNTFQSYKSKFE